MNRRNVFSILIALMPFSGSALAAPQYRFVKVPSKQISEIKWHGAYEFLRANPMWEIRSLDLIDSRTVVKAHLHQHGREWVQGYFFPTHEIGSEKYSKMLETLNSWMAQFCIMSIDQKLSFYGKTGFMEDFADEPSNPQASRQSTMAMSKIREASDRIQAELQKITDKARCHLH